jgi:N-acetylneuraminic acid mutarotase
MIGGLGEEKNNKYPTIDILCSKKGWITTKKDDDDETFYISKSRWGHSCSVVSNKIYLIGGFDHTSMYNDVNIYDFENHKIIKVDDKNKKFSHRAGHSASTVEKKIFLFGGQVYRDRKGYDFKNDLHVFDTESNTWTEIEQKGDIPSKRSQHQSFIYKNNLFIIGGHDANTFFRDIYYLNLNNYTWKQFEINIKNIDIEYMNMYHAAISVNIFNDKIYIHGWDEKYDHIVNLKNGNMKSINSKFDKKNSLPVITNDKNHNTLFWMKKNDKWNLVMAN